MKKKLFYKLLQAKEKKGTVHIIYTPSHCYKQGMIQKNVVETKHLQNYILRPKCNSTL